MIFRETTQEDLDFMEDNTESRGVQKNCPAQISYLYTLEDEGKILGVGGFRIINHHTAWCWVDMARLAKKNIIISYRVIKSGIELFQKQNNITRLQAYVECDFPEAIRMVEHLGFERESTMKNFVGKRDAYMYVRII